MRLDANGYQDLQRLMLIITVGSIVGLIMTPLMPWVTNSTRVNVDGKQKEMRYSYSEHQLHNMESDEGDLLSQDEIDYDDLSLEKEEQDMTTPDDHTFSRSRDTRSIRANSTISSMDRDLALDDISERVFQIELGFWTLILLGVIGLIGLNCLRNRRTRKAGRHLVFLSYLTPLVIVIMIALHLIILYDINILNTYNMDMGIANSEYSWWYNFAPACLSVIILIVSFVFIKRSLYALRP